MGPVLSDEHDEKSDLRGLVRSDATDAKIGDAIAAIWTARDDRYSEQRSEETTGLKKIEMSFIGG